MKIIALISLVLIVSMFSCEKIFPDDKLSLTKTPYTGNNLRIDGYYYTNVSNKFYCEYFFYSNGVLLNPGGSFNNFEEIENYIKKEFVENSPSSKFLWGLFIINGDEITLERWYPSSGGPAPVYLRSGKILNDTTFNITKSIKADGSNESEKNETYHFRKFSPKPDSTNNFIK